MYIFSILTTLPVMIRKLSWEFRAIGEITLVMIGILLALQVNNWNELRKTHLRDIEFLNKALGQR